MEQGLEKLKIYKLAHELGVKVHKMSMQLPRMEMFEEGSQIRRSSKSVASNIVEGFSLRRYKNEFLHYLYRAYASSRESVEHLRFLYDKGQLKDWKLYSDLMEQYDELNMMLFSFITSVNTMHKSPHEPKQAGPDQRLRHEKI